MDKILAKKIVEALARAEVQIQEIDALVSELDEDERESFVDALGYIVASHSELLAHVKKQFPEFDPEGKGKDLYERAKG